MVNNFMTKKEFDRIIFSQRHKKDYGPKYLRIPSVLGAILLVCLFFGANAYSQSMGEYWRRELTGKPVWTLLYIVFIVCFVVDIVFTIKRYIDLDSKYKAYMSQVTINQVQSKRVKFCESCGMLISDKSWQDGYCQQCGIKIRK